MLQIWNSDLLGSIVDQDKHSKELLTKLAIKILNKSSYHTACCQTLHDPAGVSQSLNSWHSTSWNFSWKSSRGLQGLMQRSQHIPASLLLFSFLLGCHVHCSQSRLLQCILKTNNNFRYQTFCRKLKYISETVGRWPVWESCICASISRIGSSEWFSHWVIVSVLIFV